MCEKDRTGAGKRKRLKGRHTHTHKNTRKGVQEKKKKKLKVAGVKGWRREGRLKWRCEWHMHDGGRGERKWNV